jgi:hypothetical protein
VEATEARVEGVVHVDERDRVADPEEPQERARPPTDADGKVVGRHVVGSLSDVRDPGVRRCAVRRSGKSFRADAAADDEGVRIGERGTCRRTP